MMKELAKLKERHKTYRKIAELLEVTEAHIWRVAHGQNPSKALEYRIRSEAAKVK